MLGLMQDRPLTLTHVFHRAEQLFGHKTLVTATADGEIETTHRRVGAAASAASRRCSTRWASAPTAGSARSAGTPRATSSCTARRRAPAGCCTPSTSGCSPSSSTYIANHAEDEVVFVDRSLLPLLWPLADKLETVRHVVVMDDGADVEIPDDPRVLDYETLLADAEPFTGTFASTTRTPAAAMCYTSGTTGNPKGVVYSHRSTVLHSLVVADRRRRSALHPSATSCCRWCRCSTPTPGASPYGRLLAGAVAGHARPER